MGNKQVATWSNYAAVDQDANPEAYVKHMDTLRGVDAIQAYKQETFELLALKPNSQALEVGCGPGTDAQALAERIESSGKVIGLDKSEIMIAAAQERTRDLDLPLEYQVGDVYELDFEDASFDACRADRVFHHLEEPEKALGELVRVMRPGANIVLAEPDFDACVLDSPDKFVTRAVLQKRSDLYPNGWCGRQLYSLFKKADLVDIRIRPRIILFYDFETVDKQVLGLQDAAFRLVKSGDLEKQQVENWLAQLKQKSNERTFFCAGNVFIASAQKPEVKESLL